MTVASKTKTEKRDAGKLYSDDIFCLRPQLSGTIHTKMTAPDPGNVWSRFLFVFAVVIAAAVSFACTAFAGTSVYTQTCYSEKDAGLTIQKFASEFPDASSFTFEMRKRDGSRIKTDELLRYYEYDPGSGTGNLGDMVMREKRIATVSVGKRYVTVYFDLSVGKEHMTEALDAARDVSDELCLNEMTDQEKVLAIHDYLASEKNLKYRKGKRMHSTLYGAFVRKKANCIGYSLAFYYLCRINGLHCRIVESKKHDHAWNIVQLDSLWYQVDCCWDGDGGGQEDRFCLKGANMAKHDIGNEYLTDGFLNGVPFADKDAGQNIIQPVFGETWPLKRRSIKLEWSGGNQYIAYRIYRGRKDKSGSAKLVKETRDTEWTDYGVLGGKKYRYWIIGVPKT